MHIKLFARIAFFSLCAIQSGQASEILWESPTLEAADDDPWKNRLFMELPEKLLKKLQRNKNDIVISTIEEIQSEIQMVDAQRQVRGDLMPSRMGNFCL